MSPFIRGRIASGAGPALGLPACAFSTDCSAIQSPYPTPFQSCETFLKLYASHGYQRASLASATITGCVPVTFTTSCIMRVIMQKKFMPYCNRSGNTDSTQRKLAASCP